MILLLDIGNSRTKWAVLSQHGLGASGARGHGGGTEVLPADIPIAPDHVYAANVAGPRIADALRTAVQSRWGCPLTFARTAAASGSVRNGYKDPNQLGVDRWLAVLAAYDQHHDAVCVVDAGSATTVDLIEADGLHLGGFIVPGVDLMAQSLLDATGDLARLTDAPAGDATPRPGTSTGQAIHDGAWLATAGLVDRALEFFPDGAWVIVTGGQGAPIAELLDAECRPSLVLEGLALNWRAGAADG